MNTLRHGRVRDWHAEPLPPLAEVLDLVEARLVGQLQAREELLTEIATYLVGSGGKRVRPLVMLLVFRACGGRTFDEIVDLAASLELIHSATLLHDDIIDNSETRRGKPSAYRRYGLSNALVTGDFVFSRAFQLCKRFDATLINWAAEACVSLTEGEVMQGRFRHNPAVTVDDYLEIISRKTASIFEQGARSAAYLAGAPDSVVQAMGTCGFNIGMTFQMVDDILDVSGAETKVGKPLGLDLRDGNPSLPIVLAMSSEPVVGRVFCAEAPTDDDVVLALDRIRASGVLAQIRTLAENYATLARRDLDTLVPSPDRDQLSGMIDQLVDRVS